MTTESATRILANFVASTKWSDLTESTRRAARRTAGNASALATGASKHPAVDKALRVLQRLETPPQVGLLGRTERLGLSIAPMVGGIAVHVEDFDDTHLRTVVHPGAPVMPAVLAVAEWTRATGEQALTALAVGIEVALRVANGISPDHFDRGWHLTGTVGHIGAAAAAGSLLGLDVNQMVNAIGLGATQAAGLGEAFGTMTKPFHAGKAASDGVEAALLAARGFTGPLEPIEGRRAFAVLASPRMNIEVMLADLGSTWELEANTFKPYACGVVSHPIIDAAIEFRHSISAPEIDRVEITVNPVVPAVMGVQDPTDGLSSKFSAYHCFAVGLIDGAGGPAQFRDDRATHPEIRALRRRVHLRASNDVAKGAAHVVVRSSNGTTRTVVIENATGSLQHPMTDAQLLAKAASVTEPVLGRRTSAFLQLAFELDSQEDVGAFVAASQPTEVSASE